MVGNQKRKASILTGLAQGPGQDLRADLCPQRKEKSQGDSPLHSKSNSLSPRKGILDHPDNRSSSPSGSTRGMSHHQNKIMTLGYILITLD